ncbi:MAG: hypothetical protein ACRDMJ_08905 [Solirubrobacteraceae bacterium]
MRARVGIIAGVIAALSAVTVAYAATGSYSGQITFKPGRSGTVAKPLPAGFTLRLRAAEKAGTRPPVQLDVKVKIYGLAENGRDFPTCTLARIAAAHSDAMCPKGAEVASGTLDATLGSSQNFAEAGAACDPRLDVWNGGQGKQVYFFVTDARHQCLGGALKTGGTPPYLGIYKRVGSYLVSNVAVPRSIDYPLTGLAGSMQSEQLVFGSQSVARHGRRIRSLSSFACLKGKRPFSVTTTYTSPTAGTHSQTISGSGRC